MKLVVGTGRSGVEVKLCFPKGHRKCSVNAQIPKLGGWGFNADTGALTLGLLCLQ